MTEIKDPGRDPLEVASSELEAAEEAGDDERLRILESLYESLEKELDRDVDQTGSARR